MDMDNSVGIVGKGALRGLNGNEKKYNTKLKDKNKENI